MAADKLVEAAKRRKEMAEEDLAEEVSILADKQKAIDTAQKAWAIQNYLVEQADAAIKAEQDKVDAWSKTCVSGSNP